MDPSSPAQAGRRTWSCCSRLAGLRVEWRMSISLRVTTCAFGKRGFARLPTRYHFSVSAAGRALWRARQEVRLDSRSENHIGNWLAIDAPCFFIDGLRDYAVRAGADGVQYIGPPRQSTLRRRRETRVRRQIRFRKSR